jgi:hypothetical protein
VYAILMPKGRELTPDTLFPFSRATLANAARILGMYKHQRGGHRHRGRVDAVCGYG